MADDNDQNKALLSFFLGPVQPFIEASRTLRDLWTGSYLLSWLTIAAMEPVLRLARQGQAEIITPRVGYDNPMVAAYLDRRRGDPRSAEPGFPSRFRALVPADAIDELTRACVDNCRREWEAISDAVHGWLAPIFADRDKDWDKNNNWPHQLESYFERRCVALPLGGRTEETLGALGVETDIDDLWVRRMALLERLMDMAKSVRHVPPYSPACNAQECFPVKCSLLGSFEQMGPAERDASREFWASLTGRKKEPSWPGFGGTRLQKSDRLCAVSLVKRFAWPAYFGGNKGKLGLELKELRFSDTATVAARRWLAAAPELDPDKVRKETDSWSGQWLHWQELDQEEDEEACPSKIWGRIQEKNRLQGRAPSYYAVLLMDGDLMGELLQGRRGDADWGKGLDRYRKIAGRVTHFALDLARPVVEFLGGELIYAGGDDVLALLPTDEVIACSRTLRDKFASPKCLGGDGFIKAGIAVVHHKEGLQFALRAARRAEGAAKDAGRNALALTVCRRSGEHTTAVMAWQHTEPFNRLVEAFRPSRDGSRASDRWAYKLRGELPTLSELPWAAATAEMKRLLGRAESLPKSLPATVLDFMRDYHCEMVAERGRHEEGLREFVTLCQSAAFLARGRD